jgi:nucleoid DNA-binding protein
MNKTDLIDAIAKDSGLTKTDARKAIDAVLMTIETTLKKGDEIALSGFGRFIAVENKKPKGRTGATVAIKMAKAPAVTAAAAVEPTVADGQNRRAKNKKPRKAAPGQKRSPLNDEVIVIHTAGHLSDRNIADAVGAAPSTVRDWIAFRSVPTGTRAERVAELSEIVARLGRVMDQDYIPVWMSKPIAALDDRRPRDLIAAGHARRVARLISSLEDPVAT